MSSPISAPDTVHRPPGDCAVCLSYDSLHDLTGPVNQISSIADLILKKYGGTLDSEAETLFGFMQISVSRLQRLMGGLRTSVQVLGSPAPHRRCDGNALLTGALSSIQKTIDENDARITHDPLPALYCAPAQIIFVLASLVENSIRFRSERRPEIHISFRDEGGDGLFFVEDNGIGIDPRQCQRIFSMFMRLDSGPLSGPGVGLAICKQIIAQHGGRIWVESQPGTGATFFFTLPQSRLPADNPPASRTSGI